MLFLVIAKNPQNEQTSHYVMWTMVQASLLKNEPAMYVKSKTKMIDSLYNYNLYKVPMFTQHLNLKET